MQRTTICVARSLVTAFLLSAAACSGDPNAPQDGMGFARAVVMDDPAGTNPSAGTGSGAAAFTGTIEGDVAVAVSADGATWVDLGSPAQVNIAAQSGSATDVHGEVEVPVGTYTYVRLTLSGVNARLAAGSTIGGLTITSETTVALGGADNTVVIEAQVPPFTVRADAHARSEILFDLNSEAWITQVAVQAGLVADAAVEAAARPACREEERPS